MTPYEKKKYVWKMLYIYMLGYDVDFGHMEAVSLISAPKYPEKQVRAFLFLWFFFTIGFCYYLLDAMKCEEYQLLWFMNKFVHCIVVRVHA